MREIKFRAKIKGDAGVYKVWVFDWYRQRAWIERNCGCEWVAFGKIEAFLQYTGLKDKNSTEIYEGDVVTLRDNTGKWGDEDLLTTSVKWSESGLNWNVYLCHDTKYWVVIGNIYENPELLESK